MLSHPASKWLLMLIFAGALVAWGLSSTDVAPIEPAIPMQQVSASASEDKASATSDSSDEPPTPQVLAALIAEQVATKQVIEQNPTPSPIKGLVRERPEFVSALEWSVLQEMANQSADPNTTLTRLVNALRFTKQLETWQQLQAEKRDAPKRLSIALALLSDLPKRVEMGDYSLASARQLQDELLQDIAPDAAQRAQLAEQSTKTLTNAAAAASAAASSSQ